MSSNGTWRRDLSSPRGPTRATVVPVTAIMKDDHSNMSRLLFKKSSHLILQRPVWLAGFGGRDDGEPHRFTQPSGGSRGVLSAN